MIRPCCVVVVCFAGLGTPAMAQPARISELERKVRDLESKVRDVERQRDDAKSGRDDAKREKDQVKQALEAKLKTATQNSEALRKEKEALALKVTDLEGKLKAATLRADAAGRERDTAASKTAELTGQLVSEKNERTRLQRERDELKEAANQLLTIARRELLQRPSIKSDPALAEQIEKADARKLAELYSRLK